VLGRRAAGRSRVRGIAGHGAILTATVITSLVRPRREHRGSAVARHRAPTPLARCRRRPYDRSTTRFSSATLPRLPRAADTTRCTGKRPRYGTCPGSTTSGRPSRDHQTYSSAQGLTFYRDEIATLGPADHPGDARTAPQRPARTMSQQGVHRAPGDRTGADHPEFGQERDHRMERRVADGEDGRPATGTSPPPIPNLVVAHLTPGWPQPDRVRFNPWGAR